MRHERPGSDLLFPTGAQPAPGIASRVPPPPAVFQDAAGRWRWEPADGALAPCFRSIDEALADRALRLSAPTDTTGRRVLPKEHLRKLISAVALPCPACADVYFGGVYWHRRDAGGCNWSVGIMNGDGDREACLAAVLVARTELRRRYAIADEA